MGAFASKQISLPTREEMLKATSDGKYFIEHAFFYMSGQMNMQDMLVMAQKGKCSEMIFLTAKALETSFKKYKINPARGKDGEIYFQKIDDLKGRARGEIKEGSQTYLICVTIAMFYVRIFQIYGALALTILDVDPLYYQQLGGAFSAGGGGGAFEVQEGGRLRIDDILPVSFEILRRYISPTVSEQYFKFDGTTYPLFFDKNVDPFNDTANITMELPKTSMQRKKPKVEFNLRITERERTIVFFLSNFKGLEKKNIDTQSMTFHRGAGIESEYTWNGSTIPRALEKKIIEIIKASGGISSDVEDLTGDKKENIDDRKKLYFAGEKGMTSPLQTANLWAMFTDKKYTKSHCVARAIQLVSSQALEKSVPPVIYSNICKEKFMSSSGSLPGLGQPILKEKGIFVLNQLFYDKLQEITPLISVETQPRYQALNRAMAKVFLNPEDTKMDSVIDASSKIACSTKERKNRMLRVQDKNTIIGLREQVKEMLLLQIRHTAEVVKLLKELFVLEKGKPVTLQPALVNGGLPTVNIIAGKAQMLLYKYYGECEGRYQQGIRLLEKSPGIVSV